MWIKDWNAGRGAFAGKDVASVVWIAWSDDWSAAGVGVGVSRLRFLDLGLGFEVVDCSSAAGGRVLLVVMVGMALLVSSSMLLIMYEGVW